MSVNSQPSGLACLQGALSLPCRSFWFALFGPVLRGMVSAEGLLAGHLLLHPPPQPPWWSLLPPLGLPLIVHGPLVPRTSHESLVMAVRWPINPGILVHPTP